MARGPVVDSGRQMTAEELLASIVPVPPDIDPSRYLELLDETNHERMFRFPDDGSKRFLFHHRSPADGKILRMTLTGYQAEFGPHRLLVESDGSDRVIVRTIRTDDECEVRMVFAVDGDEIGVESVTYMPIGDKRILPSSRLARRLLGGDLARQVELTLDDPWLLWNLGPAWREVATTLRRTGRAGTDDMKYALWARRYVRALEVKPTAPVKYLEEKHHLSNGTIRQYVDRARRRDLLTRPDHPRRPGGRLTQKALDLIGDLPEEES